MNMISAPVSEIAVDVAAEGKCDAKSGLALGRLAKIEMALLLALYVGSASAQSLPWEDGLCQIVNALLGKTSFCLALAGFFGCGGALIWGEELSGFAKKMLMVVMGVGVMVGGASLYKLLNSSGTVC